MQPTYYLSVELGLMIRWEEVVLRQRVSVCSGVFGARDYEPGEHP